MTRVWEKIGRLKQLPSLSIADFGTRRRHGFLWQDWCVQAMIEGLGNSFLGTSELPDRHASRGGGDRHQRARAADGPIARSPTPTRELAEAPYLVLADWQEDYDGNLRVMLPDTYGSRGFLERAPDWAKHWTGVRIDPGDPIGGGEIAIEWWKRLGQDPRQKLAIFSDGLDVAMIERIHKHFLRSRAHRLRLGHAAHQRLPRARPRWRASIPSRSSAR